MQIIHGPELALITGFKQATKQKSWLESEGITYKVNANGVVYTTDDWMNGKDKYQAQNDDGFNIGAIA
ncbi:MAG: DUF4224 domain-containing protein [Paraglaciecola sp.]|nr:DUF4224 domain-containing protein [Paraglaciecola sp.]NCT48557.1 DUF4224 domain-containing protein [Paraglaciecola sp.]